MFQLFTSVDVNLQVKTKKTNKTLSTNIITLKPYEIPIRSAWTVCQPDIRQGIKTSDPFHHSAQFAQL